MMSDQTKEEQHAQHYARVAAFFVLELDRRGIPLPVSVPLSQTFLQTLMLQDHHQPPEKKGKLPWE